MSLLAKIPQQPTKAARNGDDARKVQMLQTMLNNAISYNLALSDAYKTSRDKNEQTKIQKLMQLAANDIRKITAALNSSPLY